MKQYRIEEICKVVSGGTPSTKVSSYWNGEIIWLTPRDLSNTTSKWIINSFTTITEEGLNNSAARILPANSVLLSSRAPIGYLALAGKPLCTNQGFKSMICDTRFILPEYLYYYLHTKIEELNNISTGSTFKELSGTLLKNYTVSIHDLATQQHIVDILGSIDEKIENNDTITRRLESLATNKYIQLACKSEDFIKLDLAIELYDYKRVPLSSRERESRQGIYPYYGATGILDYVNNYLFSGEYILVAEDGTVIDNDGHPIVKLVSGDFWVNNHAHILRAKNGYTNYSLYIALKNLSVAKAVTGAVQLKINQGNLCAMELPNLNNNLYAFNSEIEPIFKKVLHIRNENTTLKILKKFYLKKFFG